MTLRRVPAFTMIAIVGLGVQAEAQAPCPEYLRLRNAATEAWKQAMRAPRSERCGALYHASLAAEATLKYADNNRESCNISDVIVVAVGLVVALAFSNLVKAFTDNIINPLIAFGPTRQYWAWTWVAVGQRGRRRHVSQPRRVHQPQASHWRALI